MGTKSPHPAAGNTAPNALTTASYAFGGDVVAVGGKVAMMPITLGTADFLVHHIHAFTIHVTVLILLKGVLYARGSRLIPDKANLGFRFPCDGPVAAVPAKFRVGITSSSACSGCTTPSRS
jgi:photosystem I P700 chlorophyll a apoprotein A1